MSIISKINQSLAADKPLNAVGESVWSSSSGSAASVSGSNIGRWATYDSYASQIYPYQPYPPEMDVLFSDGSMSTPPDATPSQRIATALKALEADVRAGKYDSEPFPTAAIHEAVEALLVRIRDGGFDRSESEQEADGGA